MTARHLNARRALLAATLVAATGIATAAHARGCGTEQPAGRYAMDVASGGQTRTVAYYVPSSYDPSRPAPLVVDFHGSTSTAGEQLDRSEWERVAEREGFVVAAPQGLVAGAKPDTFSWSIPGVSKPGGPDDMTFIKDAIAAVKTKLCVDDARVYGTGFSGGGRVLSQFICDGNDAFAAAGFVVGLRAGYPKETDGRWAPDAATCKPARPIPIVTISGLRDKTNPFEGGGQPYWQYGAQAALDRWVELDRCTGEPAVAQTGAVTKTTYASCAGASRITSFVIADAGHTWPSSTALLKIQQDVGPVSFDLAGTDEIWRFFQDAAAR
ncbi:extracellular catalytic domain type 1 short-chain-length polyhydroxyalkanoate depolymerase [Aureimonas jatrophae]|uniref:Polyhydroxybutyrate depolymerase n=1 Tax=Aureimonas jatrophae TaxID=1166073 RepID=A0A1H0KRJ0_9HYPH|nr:PHB depolymerase family esterase [Aureimonas jatrophae]MBB3948833.1 polyhydroxybutyrate depolymerase [Aureimonas jatrophae]SDO58406.1 polyhydroxybutyrate depolymerase [Aureimonas jatrophae]